jgi:hypothetical protein
MKEVGIDGALESGDDDGGQQQRHCEIKIALQKSAERGRRCFARGGV